MDFGATIHPKPVVGYGAWENQNVKTQTNMYMS
jgi:hypothetical protein